jgi:5-methylcytosine-specific restriction endonuclease McrA
MAERKSISKKIRFEIFKRDGFKCAYCGKTPPEATLEIDHVEPISKGGTDEMVNLITSCFECNRGKSNIKLNMITPQIQENIEVIKAKEEQLKEYRKHVKIINKRIVTDVNEIEFEFQEYFPDKHFSGLFIQQTIKQFLKLLPVDTLIENMDTACLKRNDSPDDALRYFCGICWNQIKGRNSFNG